MEKLYTPEEVSEMLNVSIKKLREDRKNKIGIPFFKKGKRIYYIESVINNQYKEGK